MLNIYGAAMITQPPDTTRRVYICTIFEIVISFATAFRVQMTVFIWLPPAAIVALCQRGPL